MVSELGWMAGMCLLLGVALGMVLMDLGGYDDCREALNQTQTNLSRFVETRDNLEAGYARLTTTPEGGWFVVTSTKDGDRWMEVYTTDERAQESFDVLARLGPERRAVTILQTTLVGTTRWSCDELRQVTPASGEPTEETP